MRDLGGEHAPPKRLRWFKRPISVSIEMALLVAWILFLLFILIPWVVKQGH
jgi:hypothetical protein